MAQPGRSSWMSLAISITQLLATVAGEIRQLQQIYGPRLKVTFFIFLSRCTRMRGEAALAAEATSLQGRFSEMHEFALPESADLE